LEGPIPPLSLKSGPDKLLHMNNENVILKINEFLTEEFEVDPGKITPAAGLKETLDLDSLDYIDLVVVVESNFGFKVKPEDFTGIVSFQDFYNYVIRRINAKELA
jgi:acyl carrier protein